jgi:hypothetical protein
LKEEANERERQSKTRNIRIESFFITLTSPAYDTTSEVRFSTPAPHPNLGPKGTRGSGRLNGFDSLDLNQPLEV